MARSQPSKALSWWLWVQETMFEPSCLPQVSVWSNRCLLSLTRSQIPTYWAGLGWAGRPGSDCHRPQQTGRDLARLGGLGMRKEYVCIYSADKIDEMTDDESKIVFDYSPKKHQLWLLLISMFSEHALSTTLLLWRNKQNYT